MDSRAAAAAIYILWT